MKNTITPKAFTTRNGREELAASLVILPPADLTLALLLTAVHYGLERTEAAIKATFTPADSDKIIGGMNLAASCF